MEKGDTVWFFTPNGGWRTGKYVRTIERSRRKLSMMIIEPTSAYRKQVIVSQDHVKPLEENNDRKEL